MTAPADVSLVLVAHRSSALLPAAVAAFRREAAASGRRPEVVVVEQSEDPAEAERAAACGPDRLLVRPNRGYAAGINAGCAEATARVLLVGNPDVELAGGALAPLLAALAAGWDVAGPRFGLGALRFPPADAQTPRAELARRRAAPGARWRRHLGRELARWRRAWEATGPLAQPTLSGALLAFRRELLARAGPWDEGYFLYFEETDWLRRVSRLGGRLAMVPGAAAIHRWGHAAAPARFAGRFASSRERYFRRHFPWLGPLVLRWPEAPPPSPAAEGERPTGAGWRWLLSPARHGFPAALLDAGAEPREAALALAATSALPEVTLVAWRPEDGRLAGPFRQPAPSPRGDDSME
jgi:GT2 family glycosyltransferase